MPGFEEIFRAAVAKPAAPPSQGGSRNDFDSSSHYHRVPDHVKRWALDSLKSASSNSSGTPTRTSTHSPGGHASGSSAAASGSVPQYSPSGALKQGDGNADAVPPEVKTSRAMEAMHRTLLSRCLEERRRAIQSESLLDDLADRLRNTDRIGYKDFSRLAYQTAEVHPEATELFAGSVFQKFKSDDPSGSIDVEDFLRFVQRRLDLRDVLLDLLAHSVESYPPTHITEQELERFMYYYINKVPMLRDCMPEGFRPYYAYTTVRRFFFFLDPKRTQRICIYTLAESAVMEELLFFSRLAASSASLSAASLAAGAADGSAVSDAAGAIDAEQAALTQQLIASWFSAQSALSVYNGFLDLDADRSGMLCQAQVIHFRGCGFKNTIRRDIAVQFTPLAVAGIFNENVTYEPSSELDYKRYVDLVLAVENRGTRAASQYFFRLLDLDRSGLLTPFAIKYFYADVRKTLLGMGVDCPVTSNLLSEVLDMAQSRGHQTTKGASTSNASMIKSLELDSHSSNDTGGGVTLDELLDTGHGHIILDMLLDVNAFWMYDNRESLMNQQQQQ